jgi:hypothetical protein
MPLFSSDHGMDGIGIKNKKPATMYETVDIE